MSDKIAVADRGVSTGGYVSVSITDPDRPGRTTVLYSENGVSYTPQEFLYKKMIDTLPRIEALLAQIAKKLDAMSI